jgi:hypothetical protein
MGLPRFACVAIAAFSLFPGFIMTGFAASPQDKSITLAERGSFFVGGRIVQGKGVYDPAKDTGNTNEGNTFWTDQMCVQYQIPVNPRKYPLVLVHGGGGTGRDDGIVDMYWRRISLDAGGCLVAVGKLESTNSLNRRAELFE